MLTPHVEEITGDRQGGFRSSMSTTDHIFCIRQILEKKWEYNEAVAYRGVLGIQTSPKLQILTKWNRIAS